MTRPASTQPARQPPARQPQLRVLIADPDGLARAMLQTALQTLPQINTITTATDKHQTLELAAYLKPTVLILDTTLITHPDLIDQILTTTPHTHILTIAVDDQPTALAALRAGAVGHLSKNLNPTDLAHQITRAAHGEAIIPQHLMLPLLQLVWQTPHTGWRPLHSTLTTREWEIVEHLTQHASTEQIADQLVLSPTTVYSHIKNILRKLNVHTRQDAIHAANQLRHQETKGKKTPTHPPTTSPPNNLTQGNFKERRTNQHRATNTAPHSTNNTPLLRREETVRTTGVRADRAR